MAYVPQPVQSDLSRCECSAIPQQEPQISHCYRNFPVLPITLCEVWIQRPYVILTSKVLNRHTITYLRISFPKSSRNSTFLWAKRTFCSGSVSLLRNWSIMEMILSSFRGFCWRPMSISWRYSRGLSCRHIICKYLNIWLVEKDTHTLCYTMKAMPLMNTKHDREQSYKHNCI